MANPKRGLFVIILPQHVYVCTVMSVCLYVTRVCDKIHHGLHYAALEERLVGRSILDHHSLLKAWCVA